GGGLEIAIVGLGCRFPGARDPLAYWELIRSGTVAFRRIPTSRWDHSTFYDPTTRIPDKAYVDKGAYLEDEELREFASLHYGIAPRRVQVTDPSTASCSTPCGRRCRTRGTRGAPSSAPARACSSAPASAS